jgi:hypothetical protein
VDPVSTLRKVHILAAFENRELREIFCPKRIEITKNDISYTLTGNQLFICRPVLYLRFLGWFSQNYSILGGIFTTNGGAEEFIQNVATKYLGK